MAYNSYFPMGYQPMMYQQQQQPMFPPQNQPNTVDYNRGLGNPQPAQNNAQSPFIWVSGEAGGKGYPVGPNQTAVLWDSEAPVIYIKSADGNGMPSIKVIDYTVRGEARRNELLQSEPHVDLSGYVTKQEFEKRLAEIVSCETTAQKVKADE